MNSRTNTLTFSLFALPSFWGGASRALDLGATFDSYNESESESVADSNAINSDWSEIGIDLAYAIKQYDNGKY